MRALGLAAWIVMGAFGQASAEEVAVPAKEEPAAPSPAPPAPAPAAAGTPARLHKGQFGASARLSFIGARAIVTYENTVYCGKEDPQGAHGYATVCTGRTPVALDFEGSYGVTPTIELLLELRVGVEADFGKAPGASGTRPFHLAPGARFFFNDAKGAKLFVQPQVVLDLAKYQGGNDFGVKGIEGLWIDLHRNYGVYTFVGETLEFSRWMTGAFELGVGFQGRYP